MALLDTTDPDAGFFSNLQNPQNYGLLAAGLGILGNARGPNSGNAIGAGALEGLKASQSAQQNAYLGDYRKAQATKLTNDAAKQKYLMGLLGSAFDGQEQGGLLSGATAAPVADPGTGAPPPAASPQQRGLAGMSLDQVAGIKAFGGPDLTDAWKLAHFGESSPAGSTTVLADGTRISNPSTGNGQIVNYQGGRPVSISSLPGSDQAAAATAAATTGAQEQARTNVSNQNTVINVPDGKGGTVAMTQADYLGLINGHKGGGAAGRGLGSTPSPADQGFDDSVSKASADTYNGLQKSASSADTQIEKLQRIGSLLGDYDGNKLSSTGVELAKYGNSIGLNIDPNVGNKEAAQALSNELALAARSTADGGGMPGAMSDPDRQFLVSMSPGLANSADGRKQLIDTKVKVLQRSKDVAMAARKWRQKYGRLDTSDPNGNDFQTTLSNWSAANPLFPQGQ